MKKYLLIILIASLSVSCKPQTEIANEYHITGEAPGVFNGMRVYLNKLGTGNRPVVIDTAIVVDEGFYFDQKEPTEFTEIRFLTMDTGKNQFVFLEENEPLKIRLHQDSIWTSKVSGGKENQLLQEFRSMQSVYQKASQNFKITRGEAYRSGNREEGDRITKEWMDGEESFKNNVFEMITNNPESLVSTMMIGDLLNSKLIDTDKARTLFNPLTTRLKEHPISKNLEAFIKKDEATAIGSKAPLFEGKNPEGEIIKLQDVLGKVTLIDFWASWCGPCRRENPNVVNAYQKYHEKGFNIISVSLDKPGAEAKWKAAIEKDQMTWNHISRLQHWNDPIAKQYGVSSIPATFLLDENGIIIAKNLRGKALHDKLAELL